MPVISMPKNPTVYAFVVAIIGIVGAVILVAMNKTVPDQLWVITGGAGVGGLGMAVPSTGA